ncbi:3-hydroxybutyrate oligomer hydrolase family protein [Marinicella litoralis]|uniref:Hydroxybutyrate-dimer hydrolase n=1 Tax=Marinicella litoralis TaxID=644220 RepID=A0A4R6XXN2_9GAMM|nr:3-hydroxybutyrate oligomer hydrolase family protein [Marinicella litoralis]TDR23369.1 hydroxybutyrate-dimer hydrolase [Marinicella litoralis]
MQNVLKLIPVACCMLLLSCGNRTAHKALQNTPPEVLKKIYYDGVEDDLLTAGLGLAGLRSTAPEIPQQPSAASLRQASYYHQFKALNDLSTTGGFGTLYGFDENQNPIAGHEYWGQRSVAEGVFHTVVFQLPDTFNADQACLVVAPSSGSRNVLGAVGTSGSWALTQGCAVVYTDKGTGTQVALDNNRTYQIDGLIDENRDTATDKLLENTQLATASKLHVVQKHPYSQLHPEQHWGTFVLDAAQFGLDLLQQEKGLTRNEIKVIAASVSNGGAAVLRAAESDVLGLIDAVVAAEPQINLQHQYDLKNRRGINSITTKPLIELSMNMSLFEPCAALSESLNGSPFKHNTVLIQELQKSRCAALNQLGYLAATDLAAQIDEALKKIEQLKIEQAAMQLSQVNTLANMWAAINHTYSNSYLQTTALDNLCQSAMSAFTTQGVPRVLSAAEITGMFALSNGIAPSNGVELAHSNQHNEVQSRMILATGFGLESQSCFYQLLDDANMQAAIESIKAQPEKNQVPTIVLHGQADGTVAINHASRAYYHRNQSSHDANQSMRYYEIENAQHFDAFLAYPGFNQQFVPMHPYFEQALELMHAHLFSAYALPESQLIKTEPRGVIEGQVPALSQSNIPRIKRQAMDRITVKQQQLEIE